MMKEYWTIYNFLLAIFVVSLPAGMSGCSQRLVDTSILKPSDNFLNPPELFDPRREYGYLGTESIRVPATANIYLSGAEEGTILQNPQSEDYDIASENSPVEILYGLIRGGETLDIYASGTVRHLPIERIQTPANGTDPIITIEPTRDIEGISGKIGALVGKFNNSPTPIIIGMRRQIIVPRGAKSLYLGVLDFPGASNNNQGEFNVSIEILRR